MLVAWKGRDGYMPGLAAPSAQSGQGVPGPLRSYIKNVGSDRKIRSINPWPTQTSTSIPKNSFACVSTDKHM